MPKLKTNRSARKRLKRTAKGGIKRRRASHSHLLTGKTSKRKRKLSKSTLVSNPNKRKVKRLLPYL